MPSEDEYSEAEESISEEEEEETGVKSGDLSEEEEEQVDSDEHQGSDDDDDSTFGAPKKPAKPWPKAAAKKELTIPETISTVITSKTPDGVAFVFVRSIKKRVKPVPRAFDVEYRLSQPADHPDSIANGCKVLRTGNQAKEFLKDYNLSAQDIFLFDFSQRYGEGGELTDYGRRQMASGGTGRGRGRGKRKGPRLLPKKAKKQRVALGPLSNHPLSKCVQIVYDLMSCKDAVVFNKPVQAKHAPGYFEKIKEPKDLGTIFNNLKDGIYSTAHQVRKDVTLVWKNCLIFNGPDSELTHMASGLADHFDQMFDEAIQAPQHLGMASFNQGGQWIGKKVEVYWDDDREWYSGVIVEYNPDHANEQGDSTPYRIKYNEDDADEWINLPAKDVAIIDNWDGMGDQIEPWEGFAPPVRGGAASDTWRQHQQLGRAA